MVALFHKAIARGVIQQRKVHQSIRKGPLECTKRSTDAAHYTDTVEELALQSARECTFQNHHNIIQIKEGPLFVRKEPTHRIASLQPCSRHSALAVKSAFQVLCKLEPKV